MSNDNKRLTLVSLWEMSKVETIEEFYQRKFDWIPYNCENHQTFSLRGASDYANQLNVHVNHLNRAVKETTEKTTSQIIT